MPTATQIKSLEKNIKEYKKRFLDKKHKDLDESSTRIMVNSFLTDILGYTEFEEIKTEYEISNTYADYVIQLGGKKHFVVEVKSMQIDLNEKHLRQATNYAANEGIDWVLLTNGRTVILYRVIFNKPISTKKVFEHKLRKEKNLSNMSKDLILLTKKSVEKEEIEKHWERFEVAEPAGLSKLLYYKSVVSALRRVMKQKAGLTFSEEEVMEALHTLITQPIENIRPSKPIEPRTQKANTEKQSVSEESSIEE